MPGTISYSMRFQSYSYVTRRVDFSTMPAKLFRDKGNRSPTWTLASHWRGRHHSLARIPLSICASFPENRQKYREKLRRSERFRQIPPKMRDFCSVLRKGSGKEQESWRNPQACQLRAGRSNPGMRHRQRSVEAGLLPRHKADISDSLGAPVTITATPPAIQCGARRDRSQRIE